MTLTAAAPASPVPVADQPVWRVTGYFVEDPATVDHVAARVYRDDDLSVLIVSSIVAAPDRAQAKDIALRKGWLSPLIERFRAGATEVSA